MRKSTQSHVFVGEVPNMKDGYIKVAAASVNVAVADVEHNQRQITARMQEADALGINLLVLPEL